MARFAGKTVIVTGSSNGIGRATAVQFAKDGANVVITGRNVERLEETRQQILRSGVPDSNVLSVVGDITSSAGQDDLIASTLKKFGKINILVNNAGAYFPDTTGKQGTDQSMDIYHKTFQLNLQGVIEMTQKSKPHLIATKGEIVNVSSIAGGPHGQPEFIYYSLAKAALDQYTRNTAIDLIQYGVRVNSVSPGLVATGFGEAMGMPVEAMKKLHEYMASHKDCLPCGAAGVPDDIANIITFLADKKASSYIIGQSIIADGGSSLVLGLQSHDITKILMGN